MLIHPWDAAISDTEWRNPQEDRAQVAERLESRGTGRDRPAAAQQRRRLHEIGEWKPRR